MSCSCSDRQAILKCPECGTIQTMSYPKDSTAEETLAEKPRKCLKCKGLMEVYNG